MSRHTHRATMRWRAAAAAASGAAAAALALAGCGGSSSSSSSASAGGGSSAATSASSSSSGGSSSVACTRGAGASVDASTLLIGPGDLSGSYSAGSSSTSTASGGITLASQQIESGDGNTHISVGTAVLPDCQTAHEALSAALDSAVHASGLTGAQSSAYSAGDEATLVVASPPAGAAGSGAKVTFIGVRVGNLVGVLGFASTSGNPVPDSITRAAVQAEAAKLKAALG